MQELTKTDKQRWRSFIGSEAGMKGFLWLRENVPSIGGSEPHEVIFQAGYNQGYIKALDKITETLAVRDPDDESLENE